MSTPPAEPPVTIYREIGLVAVFLLTAAYVAIVFVAPGSPVQVPFGALELLFAPGYAIGAIVFVRRPLLPPAAEFAVSVGLSVVFNVLVGLILALLGIGLAISYLVLADAAVVLLGLFVNAAWGNAPGSRGIGPMVRRELRLPAVRPSYRPAVYALLIATVVAFGGVLYAGLSQPSAPPTSSLALTGSTGTTSSVPTNLSVAEVGLVYVEVHDGYSAGPVQLTAAAAQVGKVANTTSVAWAMPLSFYPGTTSSLPLDVSYGGSVTVTVTFEFPQPGNFTLTFAFEPSSGGAPILSTGVGVVVRP